MAKPKTKKTLASVDEAEIRENIGVEIGKVGTDIFSGYIDIDYNRAFNSIPELVKTVDEMLGSDATAEAILDALKSPILSSKFYVQPVSEEDDEIEIAEFAQKSLFGIYGGWRGFLEELLTSYDYGFSVFEKVFKVVDNKIVWAKFAPRIQKSIHKWEIANKPWVDGHPAGITQQVNNTDEASDLPVYLEIPWEKLIIFSHKRRGNNYQGKSVLRGAYMHWKMKNLMYKISAVSAERFGVGIPYIKHKSGVTEKQKEEYAKLLKSIKTNEQAYAVFDEKVEEFSILTPNGGSSEKGLMQELIKIHDRKMYDAILAGFLNLTTGEGGSNALSSDQQSFFLRSIEGKVDAICEEINCAIKELIYINYGERENYPTLKCSDIGQVSMDEYVNSLKAAREGGLIQWLARDEDKMREQLRLPALPVDDEDDDETGKIASDLDVIGIEVEAIDVGVEEEPQEAEEDEANKPNEGEMMSVFGFDLGKKAWKFVSEGGELTDEHKKKIAEALRKGGSDTLESEYENDKGLGTLGRQKEAVKVQIQNLRSKMDEYNKKKAGMSRQDKKAFNKAMKGAIEAIKKQKAALLQGRAKLNKQIKERKDVISKGRKERKINERIEKAIGNEQKKRADASAKKSALQDKLKTAKNPEEKKKIQDKISSIDAEISKGFESRYQSSYIYLANNPKVGERERAFMINIRDFENYLESEYSSYNSIVTDAEKAFIPRLVKIYESSDVKVIDGVRCLDSTNKNSELQKKALEMTDLFSEHLQSKFIDSSIQSRLFSNSKRMATQSVKENASLMSEEIVVDEGEFNSFVSGYVSNVEGVLFNEPRRIKENIVLNYGSKVSVDLAIKQANGISFNRNVLKLSTITHARGAYQAIQYGNAVKQGFTMFKTVVPMQKIKDLDPSGITASMIFLILTAAEINKKANEKTEGKTSEAVNGLNLHHGAYMYYYPIASEDLEEERELAKEQRDRFIAQKSGE